MGEASNLTDYTKIFEFVRNGGLRASTPVATAVSPAPQFESPIVQVMIPRPELESTNSTKSNEELAMMMTRQNAPVTMPGALFQFLDSPRIREKEATLPAEEEAQVEAEASKPMDASIEELSTSPIVPSPSTSSFKSISTPPSPKQVTPSPAAVPVPIPVIPTYSAVFVADNSVDDGHVFIPGTEFVKSWRLRNNGTVAWPETTVVEFVGGDRCATASAATSYLVGKAEAGALADVHVLDIKAPNEKGRFVSYWRLRSKKDGGVAFGDQLWCDIAVEESPESSMTSSSIIMMPQSAPAIDTSANSDDEGVHISREDAPPMSPSTMRSSSPTPTDWSATSGSSLWEDARPSNASTGNLLERQPSPDFVFVEDEDDFHF